MTTEPERDPGEPADVRAARAAIDAYLNRTDPSARTRSADGRIDDRTAELVAREAWDAVMAVTPPPPDPATDPGPAVEPPEVAERRERAVAVVRGLQKLGHHLDETLLPGPDLAAG
ncbi:hypothetical protein [Streptomyces sp. cmx-4-9]|uniref:hypothetical protein n=1 Tax=Streptomyces sp. cmx-4-9 TaxID=2790941 RepID=UPI0039812A17